MSAAHQSSSFEYLKSALSTSGPQRCFRQHAGGDKWTGRGCSSSESDQEDKARRTRVLLAAVREVGSGIGVVCDLGSDAIKKNK